MCDTLCLVREGGTLFAKSSDRPVGEVQVVEALPARAAGGTLRTQYLEIPDAGAFAVLGSRPTWLWGLEHGVNEHRVAIGNERLWTTDDLTIAPPGLIGMDLVRLGLERARNATDAVDVMTSLLEKHGQGGPAESPAGDPYPSSFMVADPTEAWVLETSGRSWVAKQITAGAAISNRVTLTDDWTRSSADVPAGTSVAQWQDERWSAIGDIRLACTLPAVVRSSAAEVDLRSDGGGARRSAGKSDRPQVIQGARDAAAVMRHHGERPWGRPGSAADDVSPLPGPDIGPDGDGVTVCMHVRGLQVTAASMICELPADPDDPLRAWTALGSPCASVYVPLFAAHGVPAELGDPRTWERFDGLRRRAEAEPHALAAIRGVLAPIEADLWNSAEVSATSDPATRRKFVLSVWPAIDRALRALEGSLST